MANAHVTKCSASGKGFQITEFSQNLKRNLLQKNRTKNNRDPLRLSTASFVPVWWVAGPDHGPSQFCTTKRSCLNRWNLSSSKSSLWLPQLTSQASLFPSSFSFSFTGFRLSWCSTESLRAPNFKPNNKSVHPWKLQIYHRIYSNWQEWEWTWGRCRKERPSHSCSTEKVT